MIHVVAHIEAKPGQRPAMLREIAAVTPLVRAEKGCIEYIPVIDFDNAGPNYAPIGPDAFAVVEKWATIEDLRAHSASAHMAAFGAKVRDLIARRAVHVLSAV